MKKILMSGNEACGEGALRAGCRFYAGYPITPQNELIAYMGKRLDEENGVFVQSESELAAVNMILGAAATGARVMTTSSSPGISLMQEGMSYLAGMQLPAVIVNVMRGGPGLGNIAPSQADYFQATRGGGHGDYSMIVLAPSSVKEMFDMTYDAFDLADKYRNPVMILADGIIGQMMEPVEFTKKPAAGNAEKKDWALRGAKGRPPRIIRSLFLKEGVLEDWNKTLQEKYGRMERDEKRFEAIDTEGAELVIVAYGSSARIAREVLEMLKKNNIKAGLFRPITLWPFPSEALKKTDSGRTNFLALEMSAGQMVFDVRLAVQDDKRVSFFGRTGGGIPDEKDVLETALKILKRKK